MNVATKPISKEMVKLYDNPTIQEQFPVGFDGGYTWTDLEGTCPNCDHPIPKDYFRGTVTGPAFDTFTVKAIGACTRCHLATPFHYRFHKDGRITYPGMGTWLVAKPEAPRTWYQVLFKFLFPF